VVELVQPRIVKIYGAGGLRGLEAYQSGFLISAEGHVLTAWSYVLDTDFVTVTLDDGRRFDGQVLGADPRLELALLKIDATDLPFFNLNESVELQAGDRVLAFSNLYGVAYGNESASVQHGIVSAEATLSARRGAYESPYQGPVYVLDAMTNNPGAAGGALTDRQGRLAAILGKELRNSLDNTWLNYAIPVAQLQTAIDDIRAGRTRPRSDDDSKRKPADPVTLDVLGVVLISDVLYKTPPFVHRVVVGSPADKAGLKADDLILYVNNRLASSCKGLRDELSYIDRLEPVMLTVQRDQLLLDIEIRAEE
jgi:serine protease Do